MNGCIYEGETSLKAKDFSRLRSSYLACFAVNLFIRATITIQLVASLFNALWGFHRVLREFVNRTVDGQFNCVVLLAKKNGLCQTSNSLRNMCQKMINTQ